MKVGKEEIIGCLAALEKWLTIDLDGLYDEQTKTLEKISAFVESVPGIESKIELRTGSNRFMQLTLTWGRRSFWVDRGRMRKKSYEKATHLYQCCVVTTRM